MRPSHRDGWTLAFAHDGFGPRSLAFRVIAFSTGWAILALIVISTVISTLYRQASERGFDSLLSAHLFNLIGSVGVNGRGRADRQPRTSATCGSPSRNSGWYCSVEPVSEGVTGEIRSTSMTEAIPSPPVAEVPFNAQFQRSYERRVWPART